MWSAVFKELYGLKPLPEMVVHLGIHTRTNSKEQNICIAYKQMKGGTTTGVLRAVNASKYVCGRGFTGTPAVGDYRAPQTQ